jgi:choline transport protein
MTEEIKDARKQAPRAIVLSVYIGFVTGFVFLVAACFCIGDVEAVATGPTGVPLIEIFRFSTGEAGASGLAALIVVVGYGASYGLTATGGRAVYAFARDHGLPFSSFFAKVRTSNATPVNGLCLTVAVQWALLAIYFGAVQGFNTVIAIATEGFYVSYALPLLARLLSLLTSEPVRSIGGEYHLGKWSVPLNAIGLVYLLFTVITFNFPGLSPVTADNMNYTSAAVGVIMFIALITWFTTGRKHFRGPQSGGVVLNGEGIQAEKSGVHGGVDDDSTEERKVGQGGR